MPGTGGRAVCFTECTRRGVEWLLRERRYTPCGIAFSKRTVFAKDGGPALYIRGNEWDEAMMGLPPHLRVRATRLWPGAEPEAGEVLSQSVLTRSEWLVEREWRALPAPDGRWRFTHDDIAFLILPGLDWFDTYAAHDPETAELLRVGAHVVLDADGAIIVNHGVTLRDATT